MGTDVAAPATAPDTATAVAADGAAALDMQQLHDLLLTVKPANAQHDCSTCQYCQGMDMPDGAAKDVRKPYGKVTYADPGYRDNTARYPLDTEDHVRAAWSYINMPKNAKKYSSSQLSAIKSKIMAALKRFGIKVSTAEYQGDVDMTPDGLPNEEGGGSEVTMISQEAHQALLDRAVEEATTKALTNWESEKAEFKARCDKLSSDLDASRSAVEAAKSEHSAATAELEKAQVDLKQATDKVTELETKIAAEEHSREIAAKAAERAEQVKKLNLFPEAFVTEKASAWGEIEEAAWNERVTEWSALAKAQSKTDTASAFTGTVAPEDSVSKRRIMLGLGVK